MGPRFDLVRVGIQLQMFSLMLVSLGTLESRPTRSKSTGPDSERTTQTAHTNTYRGEESAPGERSGNHRDSLRDTQSRIESRSGGGATSIVHASLLEQILQNSCTTTDKQEHLKHVGGGAAPAGGGRGYGRASEELSVIL